VSASPEDVRSRLQDCGMTAAARLAA